MILMLSVRLAAAVHAYLDAYAPTNILIRTLRGSGRPWLAFSISATLAVAYGVFGAWLTSIIDSGGPGWLNPLALMCAWNMIKFGWVSFAAVWSRAGSGFRGTLAASTGSISPWRGSLKDKVTSRRMWVDAASSAAWRGCQILVMGIASGGGGR